MWIRTRNRTRSQRMSSARSWRSATKRVWSSQTRRRWSTTCSILGILSRRTLWFRVSIWHSSMWMPAIRRSWIFSDRRSIRDIQSMRRRRTMSLASWISRTCSWSRKTRNLSCGITCVSRITPTSLKRRRSLWWNSVRPWTALPSFLMSMARRPGLSHWRICLRRSSERSATSTMRMRKTASGRSIRRNMWSRAPWNLMILTTSLAWISSQKITTPSAAILSAF